MAKPNPRGHRPTDSPDTFTRERWEQELRCLDPQLFDQIAQGRRTFTISELRAMPEAMQRAIRSVKVHGVKDSSDGTTEQVVDVKLWGKTRALKLAVRAGMLTDRTDVTTGEELPAKRDTAMLKARTPTTE
jgi:hypothetical protein